MKYSTICSLILINILFIGCKEGEMEITPRIRLDRETFEKEKENYYRYSYFYEDESGKQVHFEKHSDIPDSIPENKIYYTKTILSENELFIHIQTFHSDGSLHMEGSEFYGKGASYFPTGQRVTYDRQGNITSIHDWDEEYPYPLQEVISLLEKKELSFGYQLRKRDGYYIYSNHWRVLKIDGKTGKIVLDIHRFTSQCGNSRRKNSMGILTE